MRQNRKQLDFQDVSDDVRNLNTRELFQNILRESAEFSSRIQKGCSNVTVDIPNGDESLTHTRLKYAAQILTTVFAYKNTEDQVAIVNLSTGPVIHPYTGKKESSTSFAAYKELRKKQVKLRGKEDSISSEEAITEAVLCYDLLHTDLSKPVHLIGLVSGCFADGKADPPFREAVKVLYNRSRIVNILKKFKENVDSKMYFSLPELIQVDLSLLKKPEEKNLLDNYVVKFFPMIESFDINQVDKIPAKLWNFLLLLSQNYSVYYGRCRSLCDTENQCFSTMYARIWLQKIILELYNCGFSLLRIEPVDYL